MKILKCEKISINSHERIGFESQSLTGRPVISIPINSEIPGLEFYRQAFDLFNKK
jgi:hypothetical protein